MSIQHQKERVLLNRIDSHKRMSEDLFRIAFEYRDELDVVTKQRDALLEFAEYVLSLKTGGKIQGQAEVVIGIVTELEQ